MTSITHFSPTSYKTPPLPSNSIYVLSFSSSLSHFTTQQFFFLIKNIFLHCLFVTPFQPPNKPVRNIHIHPNRMCGGAIIADFIPRRGGRRLTASELWPNSFGQQLNSSSEFGFPDQQPPSTLKRSDPPKG